MEYERWLNGEVEQYKKLHVTDRKGNEVFNERLGDYDKQILHNFRNMLVAALELAPAKKNTGLLLEVVTKLCEGSGGDWTVGGGNKAIVSHKSAIIKYYITAEEAMKLTTKKEKIIRDEQKNIGPPL